LHHDDAGPAADVVAFIIILATIAADQLLN
jgi:hypothetical protein